MTLPDLILTGQKGVRVPPGAYRTISIVNCSDVTLAGVSVDFTPDGDTTVNTPAVHVMRSKGIRFEDAKIMGRMTPDGTPNALTEASNPPQDAFIVGWPCGRGFNVQESDGVVFTGGEVTGFHRGMLLKDSANVSILGSHIHRNRTTPIGISGEGVNILLQANWLGESRSWRRRAPMTGGDHSDFIHAWTRKGQKPVTIRIIDNVLDQGDGQTMLGINLEDAYSVGYSGEITGNVQINGNSQGGSITNFTGAIAGNTFLAPPGSTGFPTIIERGTTALTATLSGNTLYDRSAKPFLRDTRPGNDYLARSLDAVPLIASARKAALARFAPAVVPMTLAEVQAKVDALWAKVFP